MKKIYLSLIVTLLSVSFSYAQWTNIGGTGNYYLNSGYVGIGTPSPAFPLDINGAFHSSVSGGSNLFLSKNTGGSIEFNNGSGTQNAMIEADNSTNRLEFWTNTAANTGLVERMRIDNLGNVGIGTTSLSSLLTIGSATTRGTLNIVGSMADIPAISIGDSRTGGHQFTFYNGLSTGSLDIYDQTAGAYRFGINSSGNFGIATDAPVSLFQVDDGCTKASIGDASGSLVLNWGTSYLGFNASRSGTSWLTNSDGGNNGGGVMYSSIFGDMYFATIPTTGGSGQTLTDVAIAGNISLKISHLDGAIYAKKIYVQLTVFPDYVFKKDYKLMPLAQVKSYIDQNHHLPDMPTDKEVEGKGLDVGEMNKLLTKKVEELTLYLIRQKEETDKQNKSQQQQIDGLKQQLNAIAKALNKN